MFRNVLMAAARAELDTLDTDARDLELLPDDTLRHVSAEVYNQHTHIFILRERERVKTHTLAPIEGSEGIDRGSEAVGSHLPFIWAERLLGHSALNHLRKWLSVSVAHVTKNRSLVRLLSCGDDLACRPEARTCLRKTCA